MIYKLFLTTLLIACLSFVNKTSNKAQYLILSYGGPQNKPVPTIIFYVNSYKKPENTFLKTFKITKETFASIKKEIETDTLYKLNNPKEAGYFNFTIVDKSETNIFATFDKETTKRMLLKIPTVIHNSKLRREIIDEIEYVSVRLW